MPIAGIVSKFEFITILRPFAVDYVLHHRIYRSVPQKGGATYRLERVFLINRYGKVEHYLIGEIVEPEKLVVGNGLVKSLTKEDFIGSVGVVGDAGKRKGVYAGNRPDKQKQHGNV